MVKRLPRLFLLLVAICMLAVSAAMAWISYMPRDVSFLVNEMEASLGPENASIRVKIDSANIDWRQWRNFGRISIRNVRLMSEGEQVFAQLPSMQVKLSALSLLSGSIGVDWVIIPRSDLVLTSTPQRVLSLGFGDTGETIPLTALYGGKDESSGGSMRLPFNHLLLEDANIAIRDPSGKLLLRTYRSELTFSKQPYGFQGAFRLNFTYRDQVGSAQSLLRYYRSDESYTIASKFINIPMGLICGIVGDCGPVKGLHGAVTGRGGVNIRNGLIADADMVLSGERLRFAHKEWFAEPLEFSHAAIRATVKDDMKQIDIDTVDLKNSELHIVSSATATRKDDGWYIDMVAKQNGLALKNLYKYWPVSLASETREWVTGSITRGTSPEAVAVVKLTPADMAADLLPDGFLRASIQVKGATVRYLPGLEPVKNVSGMVHFSGQTMSADVGGGSLLSDSTLVRAKVAVPDLNHPNVPMRTDLSLDANAKDVASILSHKAFTFDDGLKLDMASLSGRMKGQLDLDFDAFSGVSGNNDSFDVSGVGYDIDVGLENISQRKLMGAYDISGFSGNLTADASGFGLTGKGSMNASELDIAVKQASGQEVHVSAKGAMTRANLVGLGMPDRKEIGEGTIAFDASFILGKDSTILESVVLNMQNVALTIADISWQKARGVASTLTISPVDPQKQRYRISHKGGDLALNGEMALNAKTSALEGLQLKQVKTAKNDFALEYTQQGNAMRVQISGARFDNSASYTSPSSQTSENNILADFPRLHLTLDLAEFVLVPGQPFRAIKGTLDCYAGPCVSANLSAKTGDKGTISAIISSASGSRKLDINASDAGELLRAVDLTDKLNGGRLQFDGTYDDAQAPALLNGKLFITSFNVKQSQILARLFSVASLSGMANLLTGSGIDFEKLRADVTHKQGVFTLKEGRANGASTGYTTEGTIDTRKASLNLKGVLVPAYAVNSIIGKIPLIGAIAGGEGEGLISFNYRVKGSYNDPQVSVNPLSGLTPGFLRGIFDAESTVPESNTGGAAATGSTGRSPSTPARRR